MIRRPKAQEVAGTDSRFPTRPIDLIEHFLSYFRIDHYGASRGRITLETSVPKEVLEELAERFALFLIDGQLLDTAFGGGTKRERQKLETARRAWQATALVIASVQAGNTFEIAVDQAASRMKMSAANVKKLYSLTAPAWDRNGKKPGSKK